MDSINELVKQLNVNNDEPTTNTQSTNKTNDNKTNNDKSTTTDKTNDNNDDTGQEINYESETSLISNVINNNDKWSFNHLNKLQMNIIRYVLMNGQIHIPYFFPFDKTEFVKRSNEERAKTGNRVAVRASVSFIKFIFLYGFNELSSQIHRLFINGNYTLATNKAYFDPGIMVNSILDEGRHLFTNNQYRAILHSNIYSQRTLTKEDDNNKTRTGFLKMNDIDYILSKIRNLPPSYKPRDLEEIEAFNNRCQFAPYAAYRILHTNYDFYAILV